MIPRTTLRFLLPVLIAASFGTNVRGASVTFPVRASDNARFLVEANGKPFPILGRSSWFMPALSTEDREIYYADCMERGFNSLELAMIGHDPRGRKVPRNHDGDLPFLRRLDGKPWDGSLRYDDPKSEAPDFTTPNETFWKGMDSILSECWRKGFLVFAFPAYVGYAGNTEQGWMGEMVANGPDRMRTYGEFVGRRYKHSPNIVWMLGGDFGEFNETQAASESGFVVGLLKGGAGGTPKLRSAEWSSESIGTDQPEFAKYITLNGAYTFDGFAAYQGRRAYAYAPVRPAFLLEEPYDEEFTDGTNVNSHAYQPVRQFQWWGWLGSIGGYISGNGYVWPFAGETWKAHLDTRGAKDMKIMNAFIASIPWQTLVPSGLGGQRNLIVKAGSQERARDYVAAAASLDGSLLVAYSPPDRWGPFDIDMAAMRGISRARWFDPTNALYTEIASDIPNTGHRPFNIPGRNSAGKLDWVLIIEAAPLDLD